MKIPALNPGAAPYQGAEALEAEIARRMAARGIQPQGEEEAQQEPASAQQSPDFAKALSSLFAKAAKPMDATRARAHRFETMVAPRMAAIGVPKRYLIDIVDWNRPEQETTFEFCRNRFTEIGAIIALVGERGVGKTCIASQLCRDRIDTWLRYYETDAAERPAKVPLTGGNYLKLTDLIARFKPLYADFGSIDIDRLMTEREKLCKESLLCLDELHECEDQRLKSRVLTDILDRRYANRVDTLLISNETDAAFRQSIGDSALSRITEHGEIVTCTWETWRQAK